MFGKKRSYRAPFVAATLAAVFGFSSLLPAYAQQRKSIRWATSND